MEYGPQSQVTHGFPDLIYNDTLSIKSDPEITVFHNRVTENDDSNPTTGGVPLATIVAIGAIVVLTVAIFMVKRKKKTK